jgi:drug/metabolite transporter (DMT)-like permease
MKPVAVLAIILIVIGVIALAYGGFNFTIREEVAEIGPLKVEKNKTHSVPLSPVLGVLALVGGVTLLVVGRRA